MKNIEEKFKHEICTVMEAYKKESAQSIRNGEKPRDLDKNRIIEKLRVDQNYLYKELQTMKSKKKTPKVKIEGLTERGKRTRKNFASTTELCKTIETMPKKEKKFESPYLKKRMIHIRSASDLGVN